MTKILTLDVEHLRADEHFQRYCAVTDALNNCGGAGPLGVAPQFDVFSAALAREDEARYKIRKSAFTERIRAASKARGRTYASMAGITKAYTRHYDPAVAHAARRLKILFGAYGSIGKRPLSEQTSVAINILQELRGAYAADCAAVGIAGWVGRFELENGEVERLTADRFAETAAKTDIALKAARREVDGAYGRLCAALSARMVLGVAPPHCEDFVRTLNEITRKYTASRRNRARPPAEAVEGPDSGSEPSEPLPPAA